MPFFSTMKQITVKKDNFNIIDILHSGQIFRFKPYKEGFLVFSLDKACYLFEKEEQIIIETKKEDADYFYNFFDLETDYQKIVNSAKEENIEVLTLSAEIGKGIRILKQNPLEMIFSFIISQNNNIKRITNIIEKLCLSLGEKREFLGEEYHAFPLCLALSKQSLDFYKEIGLGYRAEYILQTAKLFNEGKITIEKLSSLSTDDLKKELLKIKGVGEKVANCITLFGFYRTNSFPVDTWIEKVYKENIKGSLTSREKITKYYLNRFKNYSGYYQQYLFYYKRSKEK